MFLVNRFFRFWPEKKGGSVEAGRQHQRQRAVIAPFLISQPVGQDETFFFGCQFKPTCNGGVATCGHVSR